jgi:predicted acylesterase/phospholipase RssA
MVDVLYNECKIWEAYRATSAATTFFDPITFGKYGQTFVDGEILYNNPIQLVHREAGRVWSDRKALLISIGTGGAPGKDFKGNIKAVIESMKEILTQTERTANDFHQSHADMVKENLLFRFNVSRGLANIGLEEYREAGAIADATQTYLENGETGEKLNACIGKLLGINPEDTVILM